MSGTPTSQSGLVMEVLNGSRVNCPRIQFTKRQAGKKIASGVLVRIGEDISSGDFVYRIDLSDVPAGGPYKITVNGYGSSYPFGVGGDFSRRLGHTSFRSLYHQRCGIQIMWPYAWNIRMKPCHEIVYQTYAPIAEARLKVEGTEPTIRGLGWIS
jgi:hypothetical protein